MLELLELRGRRQILVADESNLRLGEWLSLPMAQWVLLPDDARPNSCRHDAKGIYNRNNGCDLCSSQEVFKFDSKTDKTNNCIKTGGQKNSIGIFWNRVPFRLIPTWQNNNCA